VRRASAETVGVIACVAVLAATVTLALPGCGSSSPTTSVSTTTARRTVSVPDVRGMSLSAAERTLKKAKLGWSYGYEPGQSPPGSRIVQRQDPPPGSRLDEWKPVELKYRRR
jgi:hypothetical protein